MRRGQARPGCAAIQRKAAAMGVRISGDFTGTTGRDSSQPTFTVDLDHFRARILQDALAEATVGYWLRRARAFEDAGPRESDWRGAAQADDLVDQAIRCRQIAENCRHRAHLLREDPPEEYAAEVEAAPV